MPAKERLSKLQKWILTNWDNPNLNHNRKIMPTDLKDNLEYKNTLWVYDNFFGIKEGEGTFKDYDNEKHEEHFRAYKIPNKYVVIVSRSLANMEKKGLIEIPFRAMRGRGHLIFKLTDQAKKLNVK